MSFTVKTSFRKSTRKVLKRTGRGMREYADLKANGFCERKLDDIRSIESIRGSRIIFIILQHNPSSKKKRKTNLSIFHKI